jgi:hypothetical protein
MATLLRTLLSCVTRLRLLSRHSRTGGNPLREKSRAPNQKRSTRVRVSSCEYAKLGGSQVEYRVVFE